MKNRIFILALTAIIVSMCSIFLSSFLSKDPYIFNEVVGFEYFSCSYDEEFEIKNDEDLIIKLESDINKGDVSLKIYDDNGSVLYEKSGGHLNESDRVKITKGTWHYAFSCCNGEKNTDAENGSYSVRIQEEGNK